MLDAAASASSAISSPQPLARRRRRVHDCLQEGNCRSRFAHMTSWSVATTAAQVEGDAALGEWELIEPEMEELDRILAG